MLLTAARPRRTGASETRPAEGLAPAVAASISSLMTSSSNAEPRLESSSPQPSRAAAETTAAYSDNPKRFKKMAGISIPDVVRELLRDPSILRWHAEEEVYEVMDGMSFEHRFLEANTLEKI